MWKYKIVIFWTQIYKKGWISIFFNECTSFILKSQLKIQNHTFFNSEKQ